MLFFLALWCGSVAAAEAVLARFVMIVGVATIDKLQK
jgi:hypothetical protein